MSAPARRLCAWPRCQNLRQLYSGIGRPNEYCVDLDCARSRAAYRKARERASAHNAFTRAFQELLELPKRVTDHRDEDELGYETTISSRWDEIDAASQRGDLRCVNRLMREAEKGVRSLAGSAGTPVGQLCEPNRIADWTDEGKEHSIVGEDEASPAELWLRGKHSAAVGMAVKAERRSALELGAMPPTRKGIRRIEILYVPHEITGEIELGSVGSIIAGELEQAA